MSQQVGELARCGQILRWQGWESTTIAETQIGLLEVLGATPLILTSTGSSALSRGVVQLMIAKKVTHWVSHILAV